jgi:polyhydroxyalkanoate synthase subunit PhaC
MAQPATEPARSTSKPRAVPDGAPGAEDAEQAAEAATGLDMVLVDAAAGPLRRLIPPAGTVLRFGGSLARRPDALARRGGELARELGKVAVGRSELAPGKKDKRFADPAWSGNPVLRRAMQAHLATARVAWELIEDADLDWRDDERIRFTARPSSTPAGRALCGVCGG